MRRARLGWLVFAAMLPSSWGGQAVRAGGPAASTQPVDVQVDEAIRRGVKFIWSMQNAEGHWEQHLDKAWNAMTHDPKSPGAEDLNRGGRTALALLGLIHGGEDPNDPRFVKALKWLNEQDYPGTYMRGLRATLWAAAGKKFYELAARDADFLRNGIWLHGTYSYSPRPAGSGNTQPQGDFSNTQYGVLGVWSGSEIGMEIERKYWLLVQHGYLWGQQKDGGWRYPVVPEHKTAVADSYPNSRDALTLGGIASLFLVWDKYYAAGDCDKDVDPELVRSLEHGLAWVGKYFKEAKASKQGLTYIEPYTLYSLERAGVASGLKRFGDFDWCAEGTRIALAKQAPDGHWSTGHHIPDGGTAWTIMFLTFGRAPLVFNKLAFGKGGEWNTRPREIANLTRWMVGVYEKKRNWQIVSIDGSDGDLHDAPVLFVSSPKAVSFTDAQKAKLKRFVLNGGTILASPTGKGAEFGRSVQAIVRDLFPGCEMTPVPQDSALYTGQIKFAPPPRMTGLFNGIRWTVLLAATDIGCSWQKLDVIKDKNSFSLACNLYNYVSDVGQLKGRGQSYLLADEGGRPAKSMAVGRLLWGSPAQSDPEPNAWAIQDVRLRNAGLMSLAVQTTDLAKPLDPAAVPLLHATGVGPIILNEAAVANLKRYLDGGGLLLADAAGGNANFADSFQKLIAGMYGSPMAPAPASADLPFIVEATDRGKAWYRHRFGLPKALRTMDVMVLSGQSGEPKVIFLPYDLTAAMVGYPSLAPAGLMPEAADKFVTALLKWRSGPVATTASQPDGSSRPLAEPPIER